MKQTSLIITSIAKEDHPILNKFAKETQKREIPFIVIGDTKSPKHFNLPGCDFYSIERQKKLNFGLSKVLPLNHYARKNIGYLIAISNGAETIIETDDDNLPMDKFWDNRSSRVKAHLLQNNDWVNVYKYFTKSHVWPRGFALERIQNDLPELKDQLFLNCPIQQGLADKNPDVDALYRLTLSLPVNFNKGENVALGINSICPFNSQNTTWFKEAFPLMYLPSHCSFRMTDIWRSFIAQRIAWSCGWSVLFHQSTVWQERNDHNLMIDFQDEIPGYMNNLKIMKSLSELNLKGGIKNIPFDMIACYETLISFKVVKQDEISLLKDWLKDLKSIL